MKKITLIIITIILISALSTAKEKPVLVIDPGGHQAMIKDVMFTNDGRYLISASVDKTIRVWNVRTGRISRIIRGQIGKGDEGKIYAAALSPDNEWLAVGGWMTGTRLETDAIRLYHFPTGRLTSLLKGHTNVIYSLAFSPNSRYLASGSGDFTVRIWNIKKQTQIHELSGHKDDIYALSWFPDNQSLVSGAYDNTLIIWDTKNGRQRKHLKGHDDKVRSVIVSPDGKTIVSGSWDKTIRMWDGQSGFYKGILARQDTEVPSLSFSMDGKKILSGTSGYGSDICHIYAFPSGKELISFTKHDNIVLAAAISPDGKIAATGGGNNNDIYLWAVKTGEIIQKLAGKGRTVWSVGFGRDGASIAWGNEYSFENDNDLGPLQYWMRIPKNQSSQRVIFKGRLENAYNFQRGNDSSSQFSLKTQKGGSYGYEAILKVLKNSTVIAQIERDSTSGYRHRSYTLTPNNKYIISGGSNGVLTLYNTKTGDKIRDFIGHTGDVWAVATSPDSSLAVSGSDDQTVRLWDIATGENLLTIFAATDGDWVAWTPSGYYTCSPGGDKYIGWHINQGNDRNALYYEASRFSEELYKPEIVAKTIAFSSEEKAAADARQRFDFDSLAEYAPPDVRILKPDDGFVTNKSEVTLEVRVDSTHTAIKDIAVYVNMRQVLAPKKRRIMDISGGKLKYFTVPLNDKNNLIKVQVTNVRNLSSTSIIEVIKKSIAKKSLIKAKGDLYLLCVGVNHLKYIPDNDLDLAAKDAKDMAKIMTSQEGKLFKRVRTFVYSDLSSNKPDSDIIEDALYELRKAEPQDTVMIFLAGHGVTTSENDLIFLTRDAKRYGTGDYKMSSVLKWTDIEEVFRKVNSRRIIFLDTCYSGKAEMNRILKKGFQSNIAVFVSSTADQMSGESTKLGNGFFTHAILKGLGPGLPADMYKDGEVQITELKDYVLGEVKKLSNGAQTPDLAIPIGSGEIPFFID